MSTRSRVNYSGRQLIELRIDVIAICQYICMSALLYAIRDVQNSSTKFSPNEMVFGRKPRGQHDKHGLQGQQKTEYKTEDC